MQALYQHVRFRPDMVLSLDPVVFVGKREGCLICMRSDIEQTVSKEDRDAICSMASQLFEKVEFTNTVLDHNVSVEQRENELINKFKEFGQAELVITDRLHGMIFCAITGTKCIALSGKSPKIKGCYEEIKHLNFIKLADGAIDVFKKYYELQSYQNVGAPLIGDENLRILEHEVCNLIKYGSWNECI